MPTAARRTTTGTPTTSTPTTGTPATGTATDQPAAPTTASTPGRTRGSEQTAGQPAARSGAAARTRTATPQRPAASALTHVPGAPLRPAASALTHVPGAPVGPERASGGRPGARSGAAVRTGTATPQRPAATAGETPTWDRAAEEAERVARAAADKATAIASGVVNSVRTVVALPATATAAVVDDVVSAARRPDTVLYGGALIGLAALGVLEWPVAAAVGVGVAVASGVRRART
jgi:hypothetical protein